MGLRAWRLQRQLAVSPGRSRRRLGRVDGKMGRGVDVLESVAFYGHR